MPRIRTCLPLLCLVLLAAAPGPDKPKAEDILDNYIKITGGKEAHEKIKSLTAKGRVEAAAQGIKGQLALYFAAPNKLYELMDIPGLDKREQGYDGKVAWEKSTVTGARILTGEEKAATVREATLDADVNWRQLYQKAELAGEEAVNGKPAYKVIMTPNEGAPSTRFYDKESGLLVKSIETVTSAMGKITTEALISDYKKVNGVLFPHKIKQTALGQSADITFDSIEANTEIPKDRFDLPADVKKLAEKK